MAQCYRRMGVNHREMCNDLVDKYMSMVDHEGFHHRIHWQPEASAKAMAIASKYKFI